MTDENSYFGRWFGNHLRNGGYTIGDVSEAIHVDRMSLRRYRTGQISPKFLVVLGCIWFFNGDEDPETVWRACQ